MESIFITGASSGLGRAVAMSYAAEGVVLFLCGRNKERLYKTAELCKEKGAITYTYLYDVSDAFAVQEAIAEADKLHPLDLVIANAGISGGVLGGAEDSIQTRQIFDTNITGVLNTVLPALERMRERHCGQIGIVSSIAGYRGLPGAPAYSASKACLKAWGEALRGRFSDEGIKINVICPGFIETPLTDVNKFPMPFLMSPGKAALRIKRGLEKNKAIIAFPFPMAVAGWFLGIMPGFLLRPILRCMPKK